MTLLSMLDRLEQAAVTDKAGWEAFQDAAYFDLWCVRAKGESRFGEGFHVQSEAEANALVAALSEANEILSALKALSAAIFAPNDPRSPELRAAVEQTITAIARAESRTNG